MGRAKRAVLLGIDGADPMMMQRFIDEGYLPNIKKFVDEGAAALDMGMLGVQPTITPPNWATLATGAYPGTHGITCFWNHESGNDLAHLDNGFNSRICKAEYIWDAAAKKGLNSIVFNYPTGWPATNEHVIAVDGSGIVPNTKAYIEGEGFYIGKAELDEATVLFKEKNNSGDNCVIEDDIDSADFTIQEERVDKVIISGNERVNPLNCKFKTDRFEMPIMNNQYFNEAYLDVKYSPLMINHAFQRRHVVLTQNEAGVYDGLLIFKSKKDNVPLGKVELGKYSDWIYDTYNYNGKVIPTAYKLKLMEMKEDGSYYKLYRSYVLNMDEDKYFTPPALRQELLTAVGPMMHMSACEDIDIVCETQAQNYQWIADALLYLAEVKPWNLMYMHCHALDCVNHSFQNYILEEYTGEQARQYLYGPMLRHYQITDELVRRMMALDNGETVFILVSDHGGMSKAADCDIPLIGDPWAIGGKIMEDLGYLKVDRSGDVPQIVWSETKAIGQRSGYIYLNLKGRDPQGIVEPEEYDELVERIVNDLLDYKDEQGRRPIRFAFKRPDMEVLGLYGSNVGDIYFVFDARWSRVHGTSLTTASYKGTSVKAFFAMNGAGVKKGVRLARRIHAVDVVPTICALLNIPVPGQCEGGIIYQGLDELE